jgi:flagellar biosynthesis component FlhA
MVMVNAVESMAQERNQVTVTLSDRAVEEYRLVAHWLGMPVATLMRQVLEENHQSPAFGALVRRVKEETKRKAGEK